VVRKEWRRTYSSWQAMRTRCYNSKTTHWLNYGARGIKVCEAWRNSFKNFLADMGLRPTGMSLDRYPNNDGDYTPDNCRWATPREQLANRRKSRLRRDKRNSSKLTMDQVDEMRSAWRGLPVTAKPNGVAERRNRVTLKQALMAKYKVSAKCVENVVYNHSWKED
jgi:hypothetical protein